MVWRIQYENGKSEEEEKTRKWGEKGEMQGREEKAHFSCSFGFYILTCTPLPALSPCSINSSINSSINTASASRWLLVVFPSRTNSVNTASR